MKTVFDLSCLPCYTSVDLRPGVLFFVGINFLRVRVDYKMRLLHVDSVVSNILDLVFFTSDLPSAALTPQSDPVAHRYRSKAKA